MTYASIEFDNFDDYCMEEGECHGIAMNKQNVRIPFWITFKNSNWVIYDTKPQIILTEKLNATIYLYVKDVQNKVKKMSNYNVMIKTIPLIKSYNIIKFMLLKQILYHQLLSDLLHTIVDLSD